LRAPTDTITARPRNGQYNDPMPHNGHFQRSDFSPHKTYTRRYRVAKPQRSCLLTFLITGIRPYARYQIGASMTLARTPYDGQRRTCSGIEPEMAALAREEVALGAELAAVHATLAAVEAAVNL